MATKASTKPLDAEEIAEKESEKAWAPVSYELPLDMLNRTVSHKVGLNGRIWNLPRGKKITIPYCLAVILDQQRKSDEAAYLSLLADAEKMNGTDKTKFTKEG